MIRPFSESDLPIIVEIVQEGRHLKPSQIEERVKACTTWVWDDGAVLGCAAVGKPHQDQDGSVVSVWIYTSPHYRGHGIGTKLWEQVAAHLRTLNVMKASTNYRVDSGHGRELFAAYGFRPWYIVHEMRYDGPDYDSTNLLRPMPYTDQMFEDYVRLTNDGFRELRQTCHIDPIDTYPTGFDEEEARRTLLSDKGNIFFFYEDGKALGYTLLGPDFIDTITVDESYRGRGLGRKITKLSVNLLRQRGNRTVYLSVLDNNRIARRLYDSLGFELVESIEYARAMSRLTLMRNKARR